MYICTWCFMHIYVYMSVGLGWRNYIRTCTCTYMYACTHRVLTTRWQWTSMSKTVQHVQHSNAFCQFVEASNVTSDVIHQLRYNAEIVKKTCHYLPSTYVHVQNTSMYMYVRTLANTHTLYMYIYVLCTCYVLAYWWLKGWQRVRERTWCVYCHTFVLHVQKSWPFNFDVYVLPWF